ncbi:hypothetical protein N7519_007860 [Penicillium mononematosum]|uniref:uncharacterized protein n=1 Tax=Penicillium mononematosum TaxID=268346 RepID=UPI00254825AC|nr:uncharacterized protein N7519_007860 [Penicillium mononematosum]KAJ6186559.1 hypothetical protein N7519_007860 [Penicillium mononematosum]
MTGMDKLLNLPDHTSHQHIDQLALEAGTQHADMPKRHLLVRIIPSFNLQQAKDEVQLASARVRSICIKNITFRLQNGPIFGAGQSVSNHFYIYDMSHV